MTITRRTFCRIIASSALLLFYSGAAVSQDFVYSVTTSVFPPQFGPAASTITSFTTGAGSPTISSLPSLPITGATGLVIGPDGQLYVSDRNTNQILRVNPLNGSSSVYANLTPTTSGGPTAAPGGLLFVGNTLYVTRFVGLQAASGTGALDAYTFTSTGNVPNAPTFASAVFTNRTQPAGITVAPGVLPGSSTAYQFGGNIFVGSLGYSTLGTGSGVVGEVTRYDPTTGQSSTFIANTTTPEGFAAGTALLSASSVKFGPDGLMYVVDTIGNSVRKYNPNTGAYLGDFINSGLDFPSDIVFDTQNRAWVANLGDESTGRVGSIKRYDLSGTFIDTVANSGYYAQLAITPEPAAILALGSVAGLVALRRRRPG
jgi:sugar lactone lactonase YvrE